MLPPERRKVLQEVVINGPTFTPQRFYRSFQIHRVPKHDGSNHQIETRSPVALIFKAAVPDFSEPVEEHSPRKGVSGFSLVQPGLHAPAQFNVLQPVEGTECALDAPEFT
jgi:hypothetical protein